MNSPNMLAVVLLPLGIPALFMNEKQKETYGEMLLAIGFVWYAVACIISMPW